MEEILTKIEELKTAHEVLVNNELDTETIVKNYNQIAKLEEMKMIGKIYIENNN